MQAYIIIYRSFARNTMAYAQESCNLCNTNNGGFLKVDSLLVIIFFLLCKHDLWLPDATMGL